MPLSADNNKVGKVLRGIESYNFDGNTLFDKIINLKLIRKSGASITIRSDYEVTRTKDEAGNMRYEFHTVKQKPSIEVSYRQVGSDTMIKVNIRVVNLFFSQGDESVFSNGKGSDPVVKIKLNMGYRSQFRAWPQQVSFSGEEALRRFYDLDDFVYRDKNALVNSGFSATIDVLDSWPETNPPDRIVYFHGIVGSASSGLKFLKQDNFVSYFETDSNYSADCTSYMERIFFLYLTRRFIKSQVMWKYKETEDGNIDSTKILVHGYKQVGEDAVLTELTEEDKADMDEKDMWVECAHTECCGCGKELTEGHG